MADFNGTLNSNEIFAALFNMIISQEVFADNIARTNSALVDLCRVDGGLYGDTKLYYATDVLPVHPWKGDTEAQYLLAVDRPEEPQCQSIVISEFNQIRCTLDNYLTKRAWIGEGAFSRFNEVARGWLGDSKRIYDASVVNTAIGTETTRTGNQYHKVIVGTEPGNGETEKESYNRMKAQKIATAIADIMDGVEDYGRLYNDYQFMRSFYRDDMVVVWNAAAANKIRIMDLPTIFHTDKATAEKFMQYKLPARFFGDLKTAAGTSSGEVRAAVSKEFEKQDGTKQFVFAGDLIPNGYKYAKNEAYAENANIVCKIMHKRSMPYMSAFEVGTDFFNSRSLTTNSYVTFGNSNPSGNHLANYPFITVYTATA